jgi:hypothetical protein
MEKLITRKQFAEMAGVSGAAVTKACSASLKGAVCGRRINSTHPDAVNYLKKHDRTKTTKKPVKKSPSKKQIKKKAPAKKSPAKKAPSKKAKAKKVAPKKTEPHTRGHAAKNQKKKTAALKKLVEDQDEDNICAIPEDIQSFADMTLRDLIERFGTDTAFKDWLSATKQIEEINEKRLKNAVRIGTLVSRDLVRAGVIEPIDSVHIKLLSDGSKAIARRATAMHDAGRTVVEIENWVSDQITSYLRPVKVKVARALKNAANK